MRIRLLAVLRAAAVILAGLLCLPLHLSAGTVGYVQAASYPAGAAGETPVDMKVADVNGDGRDDVIVLTSPLNGGPTGHVSILLGQADGTLLPGQSYAVPAPAAFLVLKDLNGDGKLDIAVMTTALCCTGSNDIISILLGHGDGTFSAPVNYSLPGQATGDLSIVDVNNDGKPDLLTTLLNFQTNSNGIVVLLGNGDGTFQPPPLFSSLGANMGPEAYYAVGDFDGDGKPDVVGLGNFALDTFLGNGNGTFNAPLHQQESLNNQFTGACFYGPGPAQSQSLPGPTVGDFNADGRLDFVFGSQLILGNGDGTFQQPTAAGAASQPACNQTIADFDNDGKLDTVTYGLSFGETVTFQPNYQDALPDQPVVFLAGNSNTGLGTQKILAANLSGTGRLDLVMGAHDNSVRVMVNNTNGSFQAVQSYTNGIAPGAIAVGDFNGDGFQDEVIANRSSNNLTELLSRGNGTFRVFTLPTGRNPQGVAVGDLRNIGKQDIVVANALDNTVGVLLGNGNGTFTAQVTYPVGTDPRSIQIEDFNGDGKLDLVTVNHSGSISVLLGNGDGTFQIVTTFSAQRSGGGSSTISNTTALLSPRSIAVADLNGDHKTDLVVANTGSNNVLVLLNDGTGHFSTAVAYPVGSSPLSVAIGDLNRDGKPDIVVANSVSNNMSVLLGNGDGTFQAAVNVPAGGTTPSSVGLLDSRNSGKLDMVVANGGSNNISVFPGNGDGTFQPPVNYTAGDAPLAIHVGNFGGGGLFDLSAANNLSNSTFVYLNGGVTLATASSSAASTIYGQPVTLTAQFKSSLKNQPVPTGTAAFVDGSTFLATITLDNTGTVIFTTAALAPGVHNITATYSGDQRFLPSVATFTQTVSKENSAVGLNLLTSPSTYGQPVSFSAQVTSAVGTATGNVTFNDGVTALGTGPLNGSGMGNFTTTAPLTVGTHSITAAYSGDAFRNASVSIAMPQVVNQAGTSAQITSSLNPSTLGASVTFTAVVTSGGGVPSGTVTFMDGAANLGSGSLNGSGQAVFSTGALTVGTHSITGVYSGDSNFSGSTSPALNQVVSPAASSIAIVSSLDPATVGGSVTFTATVGAQFGGTPGGSVIFYVDGTPSAPSTLAGGIATLTTTTLAQGEHAIYAIYGGDTNHTGSSSNTLSQIVNSNTQFATQVTLAVSITPARAGEPSGTQELKQTVKLTATVTSAQAGTPTGTIFFQEDGGTPVQMPLVSGSATLSPVLAIGPPHTFAASYGGDSTFGGNISNAVMVHHSPRPR